MFDRDERRMRHRECLELEASYGQFLPCESHGEAEDVWGEAFPAHATPLARRFRAGLARALHAARHRLQRSGLTS